MIAGDEINGAVEQRLFGSGRAIAKFETDF